MDAEKLQQRSPPVFLCYADKWSRRRQLTRLDVQRPHADTPLHRYARTLENHGDGICACARFRFTTARIEAGNVAIGMIRKRASGLLDQDYFKLKIRQTAILEPPLALFPGLRSNAG